MDTTMNDLAPFPLPLLLCIQSSYSRTRGILIQLMYGL